MNKKAKKNKFLLELLIAILTITGCTTKSKLKKADKTTKTQKANKKQTPPLHKAQDMLSPPHKDTNKDSAGCSEKEKHTITVWIHGTRVLNRLLQKKIFKNFFFYREAGLKKAKAYSKQYNPKKIAQLLHEQNTKRFVFENFYFFGWSGKLSPDKRIEAATNLHVSLTKLIIAYKTKHGINPKIRLITHSHGGNVALCLSELNKNEKEKIYIDELILLACPVQERTAPLIKDNTFKKVYSLYSNIDMLQVMDPQGLHIKQYKVKKPLFSKRVFEPNKKLIQTRLKINGRGIFHLEFMLTKFIKLLPHILDELDTWDETFFNNATLKVLKISTYTHGTSFRKKTLH